MRIFQDASKSRKRSFISAFSIRMTVPVNKRLFRLLHTIRLIFYFFSYKQSQAELRKKLSKS